MSKSAPFYICWDGSRTPIRKQRTRPHTYTASVVSKSGPDQSNPSGLLEMQILRRRAHSLNRKLWAGASSLL